jgi:hypothetical protein
MTEKPTSFQLPKPLRNRMKVLAPKEGFTTMIKWLEHQVKEGEKRTNNDV